MSSTSRVLIVDDDPANHAVAGAILTAAGWQVDRADNGDAAIEAANGRRYALILMDIQMPGLNGFAAARAIRAGGGDSASAPILAFTAARRIDAVAAFRAAGMDGHIDKPFTAAALRAEAERWWPATAPSAITTLVRTFGAAEIAHLIDGFREQLEAALAHDDAADRHAGAHRLAGVAGTLGFPEVSRLWLAVSEGDDTAYAGARTSTRKVLAQIDANPITIEPRQTPGARR